MSSVTPDSSDKDLLDAAAINDDKAFKLIYDRYATLIYRYAATRVQSAHAREDVTQEVFLTFWRRRASVSIQGETLAPWLLATAGHQIQNQNRSDNRSLRTSAEIDSRLRTVQAVQPSAESEFYDQEFARSLHDAIQKLPAIDQRLYLLCHREGMTYEEAALVLNISKGSVRNRLSRLRNQLKVALRVEQ